MLSATTRAATRGVLRLAVPAVGHTLLQTLVFVIDRAMLGWHSNTSVAAMQIAGPIEWSIWSIAAAFEVGLLAHVGSRFGAREPERVAGGIRAGFLIALFFGFLLAAVGPLVFGNLGSFAPRSTPPVISGARDYLAMTMTASPIVFLSLAGAASLQAQGDTRTPLVLGIIANLVHIPLNYLLIFGAFGFKGLGPLGCGISTVISFGVEAVAYAYVLRKTLFFAKVPSLAQEASPPSPATSSVPTTSLRREGADILRITWPTVIERCVYHTGFLLFIRMVTELPETDLAANQTLIALESICFLSADGIGVAAAALAAQNMGAKAPEEAVRDVKIATVLATLFLGFLAVLIFLLGPFVLFLFSKDVVVRASAAQILPLFLIAEPLLGYAAVLARGLRGAGFTKDSLIAVLVGALATRLLATAFFVYVMKLGLWGVWLGSTADWLVRSLVLTFVAKRRARQILATA
ncbi:MAG: MATE family efflux transporter [Polyangiaceae bacterium]|nr:MATE family efflux transporter [Polyangiaceae bacterium]